MQIKATEQASLYPSFDMLDQLHFKLIELASAESEYSESIWRLGKHFLDSYMMLFIAEGEGWITVDGQFIELRSGAIYIGLPGRLVEAEVHAKGER